MASDGTKSKKSRFSKSLNKQNSGKRLDPSSVVRPGEQVNVDPGSAVRPGEFGKRKTKGKSKAKRGTFHK